MLSLSANAVAKVWWKSNVIATAVINLWKMLLVKVNISALKNSRWNPQAETRS